MENKREFKNIWNDSDFNAMSWHDCKIYAIAFDSEKFELAFDIDYIIEWIKPNSKNAGYKFSIVPSTLVFGNVHSIEIGSDTIDLIILSVNREGLGKPANGDLINVSLEYKWTIETTSGEISFTSIGYQQFARMEPVLVSTQALGLHIRNGISFDKK
ncbi:MAG: hypothetical protein JST68_29380 [Bacteroidetes bacterium]|nr:hypothetical protein [Bacteroidota bacterium]